MEPSSSLAPKGLVIVLRPPKGPVILLKTPQESVIVLKATEQSDDMVKAPCPSSPPTTCESSPGRMGPCLR